MSKEVIFYNLEFEKAVREALDKWEGAITDTDLLNIEELYCDGFSFSPKDYPTLYLCKNVKDLCIKQHGGVFDFSVLTSLKQLRYLTVCDSIVSWKLKFTNISALGQLPCLEELIVMDFDCIDLTDIKDVPQLTFINVGWSCSITGLESVTQLPNLQTFWLTDTTVPSLEFLNHLSPDTDVELLGVETDEPFDLENLKRFPKLEVESLRIAGEWYFCPLAKENT